MTPQQVCAYPYVVILQEGDELAQLVSHDENTHRALRVSWLEECGLQASRRGSFCGVAGNEISEL